MERGVKKIKFGQEIFYGNTPDDVPYVQLSPLDEDVLVSYTGPDEGLVFAESCTEKNGNPGPVAGCKTWTRKEPQAYGICMSLYEQHPISMKMSGEPIADSFAICARKNNTILIIADGVNWGEKSRLAARCAVYGSMKYLNYKIFDKHQQPATTQDAVTLLRKAVDEAHRSILAKDGGLTTMCACLVSPVDNSDQHAICCVNVGDSYGYVYSYNQGIREVTIGSHDVSSERDIRDAGGAIGPVDGRNPELQNLTCSVTFGHRGDIVFLTTDGVSDNFDPVVTKIARPLKAEDDTNLNNKKEEEDGKNNPALVVAAISEKPEMSPKERHVYAMKEMERVVHEYELLTEEMCSAQEFCSAVVQHVLTVTDYKRKVLENPALYAKRRMTSADRKRRDTEIVDKMAKAPGKLDHASIVAVEIGGFVSLEEEKRRETFAADNNPPTTPLSPVIGGGSGGSKGDNNTNSAAPSTLPGLTSPTSPVSPSSAATTPKKSGARKLLSKLKNLPSPTSSSSSPSSSPHAHHHGLKSPPLSGSSSRPQSPLALQLSPRKFFKQGRSSSSPSPASASSRLNANSSELDTPASPTIPESPFESEHHHHVGVVVFSPVSRSHHRHHHHHRRRHFFVPRSSSSSRGDDDNNGRSGGVVGGVVVAAASGHEDVPSPSSSRNGDVVVAAASAPPPSAPCLPRENRAKDSPDSVVVACPQKDSPHSVVVACPQKDSPHSVVVACPQKDSPDSVVVACPQKDSPHSVVVACPQKDSPDSVVVACPQKSRVASPESRVASPESTVASPEGRVASPEIRVASPESRVASLKGRVASPESRVASPNGRVASPESRVASRESRVASPESRVAYPESRVASPESRVAYPESRVAYPESKLASPESRVAASPESRVAFPASRVAFPESRVASPESSSVAAAVASPGNDVPIPEGVPSSSSPAPPVWVDPSNPSPGPLHLRMRARRSQVVSRCVSIETTL